MPYEVSVSFTGQVLLGLHKCLNDQDVSEVVEDARPEVRRCPLCAVPTHPYGDGFVHKKKSGKDLGESADGFFTVSRRGKDFFDKFSKSQIKYYPMPSGDFVFRPMEYVYYDLRNAEPIYKKFCPSCGRLNAVGVQKGHNNVLAAGQKRIGDFDVVTTRPLMGDALNKGTHLIFGDGLVKEIGRYKFKGISEAWPIDQPEQGVSRLGLCPNHAYL